MAVPIYQTVAYAFDDTQHGADLFDLKVAGNIYTRIMNPTQDVLEQRIAALEGGVGALALASGQAAVTYAIQTIAEAGDNIVSASTLYGGTYNLFAHTLPQFGITTRFADARDPSTFDGLIDERTLALRMDRITDNTLKVARFLSGHAKVKWVNYAGLEQHRDHALALKYLGGKPSGVLTFGVNAGGDGGEGGVEGGARFQDALQLFTRLVNIGDAKSLACHPASTAHRQLNAEELAKAGVTVDTVRLSIGIEHIDDLLADLEQALAAV